MATIKMPSPNLKRVPNKNIIFEDWSAGMVTSVEGDNRDPRTSNLINNLTNRYHGSLTTPNKADTYYTDPYDNLQHIKRWMFIYANDTEYILAWLYGNTANHDTLEICDTSDYSWTELYQMSTGTDPYYNVDYLDWTVSSSGGSPSIYITYQLDDGTGGLLKASYKNSLDAIPIISKDTLNDTEVGNEANKLLFDKTDSGGTPDTYGYYMTEDGSATTPGITTQVSVGDIVAVGWTTGPLPNDYFDLGVEAGYVSLARVVSVAADKIELDRSPFPGRTAPTAEYNVAKLSLDHVTTVYASTDWYCRPIEQARPPLVSMFGAAASYAGVQNPVVETDDFLDVDLEAGFSGATHVTYGISYALEGGQHTAIRQGSVVIANVEADEFAHIGLHVRYANSPSADLLWYDSGSANGRGEKEINALNLWRKKSGEDEFGLLATIPRYGWRHNELIEDFYSAGATGMMSLLNGLNYCFVNVVEFTHNDGGSPDKDWVELAITDKFWDTGDALAQTFRTVTGVEQEDAEVFPVARSIASIGERIFLGNAMFPYDHSIYPQQNINDDVVYSVANCGCMFSAYNTVGYHHGSKDAIIGVTVVGSNLYIFKSNAAAVLSIAGDSEFAWTPRGEFPEGLLDLRLLCKTPHGPVWFSHDGLYLFSKDRPVNIAKGLHDEYVDAIGTLSTCALSYEPRFDRLYVRLGSDAYWFGFDQVERGWKQLTDVYTYLSLADNGRLCAYPGSGTVIEVVESDTVGNDASEWHSGELTLGSVGEEIKLKRIYVWYEYKHTHVSGGPAHIRLSWYIDGSEQSTHDLDLSVDDGTLTSNLEKVYVSGRGRRVEFRIETSTDTYSTLPYFKLKKVEVIYKTTRMK